MSIFLRSALAFFGAVALFPFALNGCSSTPEASKTSPFGPDTRVEFALRDVPPAASRTAEYRLIRVVLRDEVAANPGGVGGKSLHPLASQAGLPTSQWGRIRFGTLVFECTSPMSSSACGPYTPGNTVVSVGGAPLGNAVTEFQMPSDDQRGDALVAAAIAFSGDTKTRIADGEDTSNGRMTVTVPIGSLVNLDNPAAPVTVRVAGADGATSSRDGALQASPGADAAGSGACTKQDDCCPNGLAGCTKVCTYAGQCRDGECQNDANCPSGHCRLNRCVDCEKKSDCPAGSYCNTEGNEHKCRPGGCDKYGNDDCGCDAQCNTTTHQCEPADCNSLNLACGNNDCAAGEKCVPGGQCVPSDQCRGGNFDCPKKQCCSSQKYPVPGTCQACGCNDNTDCPTGKYCDAGQCLDGCWSNSSCPGCTYCDTKTHACKDIEVAGVKQDCPPGCDNADDGSPDDGGGTCFLADGSYGTCCAPGICKTGGCGGPQCPDGRSKCKGACCGTGETCNPSGGCQPLGCPGGQPLCNGACCTAGQTCGAAGCLDPCADGLPRCGGVCCEAGKTCANNACVAATTPGTCLSGQQCCPDTNSCGDQCFCANNIKCVECVIAPGP